MTSLLKFLYDNKLKNKPQIFSVIIETFGSAPQVPGASAIFSDKGLLAGTLGGGVLEFEAENRAQSIMGTETSILFTYDLNVDISESRGAICGGRALVLLDSSFQKDNKELSKIQTSFNNNKPGVLITEIKRTNGDKVLTKRTWYEDGARAESEIFPMGLKQEELSRAFENGSPLLIRTDETMIFLEPLFPSSELVIIGAGHIGQALTHLGCLLDFDVTVIDERPDLANRVRLPDASRIIDGNIESAMQTISITRNTYIVIVSPGHTSDAMALRQCISSGAAYIGMIGSKRKIALMKKEFIKKGWATSDQFNNVHAPIGLPIPSKTVQEIAVSIAAELIVERKRKEDKSKTPIVWSVILAAGESRRMNKQKLLLQYGARTIIEIVVQENLESKTDNIVVVLGSDYKRIIDKLRGVEITIVRNENYKNGMLSSVKKAIGAIPTNISATLISLGDQPMIKSRIIDELISAYINESGGIIIPVYNGNRGHPILIDKKYFREILDLPEGESLRTVIINHPDDVFELEVNTDDILRDIDTKEQYENEINKMK